jgi:hypothetical protein
VWGGGTTTYTTTVDWYGSGGSNTTTWTGTDTGSTGGCGTGGLVIVLGDPLPTCADPQIMTPCGGHFGVTITLPIELVAPGTISLSDPGVSTFFSESGAPYASDSSSCPGGGGSFIEGTLTIQSLSPTLVFTLQGTQPFLLGAGSADGTYSATRCW